MAGKVILFIFLLPRLLFGEEALTIGFPMPPSFQGKTLRLNDKEEVVKIIRVVEAYPHLLRLSLEQEKAIKTLKENELLYDKLQKELEKKRKKDKIILIALGVALPIAAGVSGWLGYRLGRSFR